MADRGDDEFVEGRSQVTATIRQVENGWELETLWEMEIGEAGVRGPWKGPWGGTWVFTDRASMLAFLPSILSGQD